MKNPFDEPKTKTSTNKISFTEDRDDTKNSGKKISKFLNPWGIFSRVKGKLTVLKEKIKKDPLPAWLCFIFLLIPCAVYEYFNFGKRLHYSSITILVSLVFALYLVISYLRKIREIKNDNFVVRFFKAHKLLKKVQEFAIWLDTIKPWQRFTIVVSIFIIGLLFLK
ncbi:hypothetical protein RBJ15_00995 [Pantoea sp. BS_4]|uniref:hypothetical protein n=1 Tax=unclassified Pantoea TaxID=2630326 RepID=UPI003F810B00